MLSFDGMFDCKTLNISVLNVETNVLFSLNNPYMNGLLISHINDVTIKHPSKHEYKQTNKQLYLECEVVV